LCKFDESGLWEHRDAWFSVYGTLFATGKQFFIDQSAAGYSAAELDQLLHVQTKQALLHLYQQSLVDRQFLAIKSTRHRIERAHQPVIGVDGKKREMIGLFKNNGRAWREKPKQVNDHDFRTDAIGVALPYGICDVSRNTGMVMVGITRETPAFAVDAIDQWWRTRGRKDYPGAERLLILADSGGANSARSRVWKCDLQQKSCNRRGLSVTVHHYPPGSSKWNPIEYKLFSEISKNWQGVPLESYETAINYICSTETRTGLKVKAILNSKS
jgi:Rhodopirellula transposase DDE domain